MCTISEKKKKSSRLGLSKNAVEQKKNISPGKGEDEPETREHAETGMDIDEDKEEPAEENNHAVFRLWVLGINSTMLGFGVRH